MNPDAALDLSIVQINLPPPDLQSHGWWSRTNPDTMAGSLRRAPQSVHIESPLCRDHDAFCQALQKEAHPNDPTQVHPFVRPPQVDNELTECTPQFSLRNIPKVERYYDLSRKPPFEISELPLEAANEDIHTAHAAHIEPVEFINFNSSGIISDLRVFLEEILYLCPWDQISRGAPPPESLWHISQSQAHLAKHLLDQRNSLFIYSYTGTHKIDAIEQAHGNPHHEPST